MKKSKIVIGILAVLALAAIVMGAIRYLRKRTEK